MELALVLLCVLVGTGAIVYAGLSRPRTRPADAEPGAASPAPDAATQPSDTTARDAQS